METVDPTALPGRPCSIAAALEVVGDRWSLLVVREVSLGHHRFSEIAVGTGAPRDRLTARLNRLVEAGVLERRPYSDAPPRSDYHLTPGGWELMPVLHSLRQWADTWVVDEPPAHLVHGAHDQDEHTFDGAWTCRTCGKPIRGTRARMVTHDVA